MFYIHFISFLCIFWDYPINKMPQCQFLFSAVFVFQKSCSGNILGIGRNLDRTSYFSNTYTESKGETEATEEAATPGAGAAPPPAAPGGGVTPSGASRRRPFAYIMPSSRKP